MLTRNLQATEDRYSLGGITITDVHQSRMRLSRSTADRLLTEGLLEAARATYRNVIGDIPTRLTRPPLPQDIPASKEEAIKLALAFNPSVLKAAFNERAGRDNIDQTRGELFPSLDLSASAARAFDGSTEKSRVSTYKTMLTLSMPIYQSGVVYSRLREAKQEVSEQRQLLDQARRDATEATDQAWESIRTARSRIESFDKQIDSAEVALGGVQNEAASGTRSLLDVLDAEQELLDAKVSLVRSQRDEIVAIYELKEAMGQLTAQQLDLAVDYYDPKSHYQEVKYKPFGGSSTGAAGDIEPTDEGEVANPTLAAAFAPLSLAKSLFTDTSPEASRDTEELDAGTVDFDSQNVKPTPLTQKIAPSKEPAHPAPSSSPSRAAPPKTDMTTANKTEHQEKPSSTDRMDKLASTLESLARVLEKLAAQKLNMHDTPTDLNYQPPLKEKKKIASKEAAAISPLNTSSSADINPAYSLRKEEPWTPDRNLSRSVYWAQLNTARSHYLAKVEWAKLLGKYDYLIGDRSPTFKEARIDNLGHYVRIFVGPFTGRNAPIALCAEMVRNGDTCQVKKRR